MTFEIGKGYTDGFNQTWHVLCKAIVQGKIVLSLERRMPLMYAIGVVEGGFDGTRADVLCPVRVSTIIDRKEVKE